MSIIAIFGNSFATSKSSEWQNAEYIGKKLSENFDILTGGKTGVMEAAFAQCSENTRKIGIIMENETPNKYVTEVIKMKSYLERMNKLAEMADAYVVLSGGTGTLLEFALVWALTERNIIKRKPIIVVGEMWNEIIQTMAFYNEHIIDTYNNVIMAENADYAIDYINKFFEV